MNAQSDITIFELTVRYCRYFGKQSDIVRKFYDNSTMTAKDLLNKVLDYNYLWSSSDRKNSKPATVRLSQIEVLQEAFGLTKKYVNPFVQIKIPLSVTLKNLTEPNT